MDLGSLIIDFINNLSTRKSWFLQNESLNWQNMYGLQEASERESTPLVQSVRLGCSLVVVKQPPALIWPPHAPLPARRRAAAGASPPPENSSATRPAAGAPPEYSSATQPVLGPVQATTPPPKSLPGGQGHSSPHLTPLPRCLAVPAACDCLWPPAPQSPEDDIRGPPPLSATTCLDTPTCQLDRPTHPPSSTKRFHSFYESYIQQ